VIFASMPFGPLAEPSLGLSLLQAVLPPGTARILYFTLPMAELAGADLYQWIAETGVETAFLPGEWVMKPALFDEAPGAEREYLEEVLRPVLGRGPAARAREAELLALRRQVPAFVDRCAMRVLEATPRLVGLTSVFQQHLAALALARRLKERSPAMRVVLGGANCEGPMGAETARRFPWLDAVVSGEGEVVLPELVRRAHRGLPLDGLPGVFVPGGEDAQEPATAPRSRDLDALPVPGFDDFFGPWAASPLAGVRPAWISLETSRGCWWGEKSHCTFCGLNGSTMTFRSKSPGRALEELTAVARRHPGVPIRLVDNILDPRYLKTLLPDLARTGLDLELFYEVKANLTADQLAVLAAAGVRRIQPGIESLADGVLRRMGKGVTMLQNLALLRGCAEVGLLPSWNLLWGFPGEDPADYAAMAELVPALTHLTPPVFVSRIRLDRFSPNFERAAELGFTAVEPAPAYRHLYPLPASARSRLAYFFTYGYADGRDPADYTTDLRRRVAAWQACHPESRFFARDGDDRLLLWDRRPGARRPLTVLTGWERDLYRALSRPRAFARLVPMATAAGLRDADTATTDLLETWRADRLVVESGGRWLALAVTVKPEAAPPAQA
jgi:ribosomal peptide maturation radical SAM protein 1